MAICPVERRLCILFFAIVVCLAARHSPAQIVSEEVAPFAIATPLPTATEPPPPTPVPAYTPAPIIPPTLTPTATPTPQCLYVAAWDNYSGFSQSRGQAAAGSLWNLTDLYAQYFGGAAYYYDASAVPSCINFLFNSRCYGPGYWPDVRQMAKGVLYGDCDAATVYDLANFIGAPPFYGVHQGPVTYYMDANCRYVQAPSVSSKLCGFAGWSWSPISLVLEPDIDINRDISVVEFPLDPVSTRRFSLWKASESAPLLVFNPESRDVIDSPAQLFGNWSFGGKPNSDESGARVPWSDGYEALGSLDADANGKIDGAELYDLDLWFDRDRDARVSPGELRSVGSEGIEALYYRAPHRVKASSKDLSLDIGFDRRVGDTLVHGRSVDWYVSSFVSKQEAADALSGMVARMESVPESVGADVAPTIFKPHSALNLSSDVSGYWVWMSEAPSGERHPGLLALEHSADGALQGYVVSEALLAPNRDSLHSAVTIAPLKGSVSTGQDGSLTMSFQVHGKDGAILASNTVQLNKEGTSLAGEAIQRFESSAPEAEVRSAQVQYRWIAGRIR